MDLKDQLAGQSSRILPCKDFYCLALDGHAFYRALGGGGGGYYHGGYWVDTFAELSPGDHLSLNTKLVLYNPAASYGVVSQSWVVPFVGITWKDDLSNYLPIEMPVRLTWFDIDRQTLGAGLTLEQKEMSGVFLEAKKSDFRFRLIADGTGGYNVGGDMHCYQFDYGRDLVGVYRFKHDFKSTAFQGIYSQQPLGEHFSYRAELATRNQAGAGMLGASAKFRVGSLLDVGLQYQVRYYGKGFASGIERQIEHDYLSIEQEDLPFTQSTNIFVIDDFVLVNAANLEVGFELSDQLRLFGETEVAGLSYRESGWRRYFFGKAGVRVCPTGTPDRCGFVFLSNKQLTAVAPTYVNDRDNKFQFQDSKFVGLDARFSF